MSTHVLVSHDYERAVLVDSVTGIAFGPVITDSGFDDAEEQALHFLDWLAPRDARRLSVDDLCAAYHAWRVDSRCKACGTGFVDGRCDSCERLTCDDCRRWLGDGPDSRTRCTGCDDDADDREAYLDNMRDEARR